LPSWNLLLLLVAVLGIAFFLLRQSFIKLHAKAQIALRETLEASPVPNLDEEQEVSEIPRLLHKAKLVSVTIPEQSLVIGKMISELRLRSETGASIVGIERHKEEIINPPVDEEIHAGDKILLIGSHGQIEEARKVFSAISTGEEGQ